MEFKLKAGVAKSAVGRGKRNLADLAFTLHFTILTGLLRNSLFSSLCLAIVAFTAIVPYSTFRICDYCCVLDDLMLAIRFVVLVPVGFCYLLLLVPVWHREGIPVMLLLLYQPNLALDCFR
jgi:hypothetical protein